MLAFECDELLLRTHVLIFGVLQNHEQLFEDHEGPCACVCLLESFNLRRCWDRVAQSP